MTEPQQLHRCERAARCYNAEKTDDTPPRKLGAICDRPLCDTCERAVAQALDDAPALYRKLRAATLTTGTTAVRTDYVKASKGSPMPLNAAALHLGEQLAWLLTTWEDEIRSIAGLSMVSRRPFDRWERTRGQIPEGRQVAAAAQLLGAHLTAWIAAPSTVLSTSRWTEDIEQSGVEAAIALLEWRNQVRNLPGLDVKASKATRRYEHRCPACGVRAITHQAGDDLMQCQSCGATAPYLPTLPREADYQLDEGAA